MRTNKSIKVTLLVLGVFALLASYPLAALAADTQSADETTTVFYFHGKRRCMTCKSIESTAAKVVREQFAKELESGKLAWRVVNFEEKGNEHYVKELGLVGSGVVVARVDEAGKVRDAKTLQKVWRLSSDESGMREYLLKEVSPYLVAKK